MKPTQPNKEPRTLEGIGSIPVPENDICVSGWIDIEFSGQLESVKRGTLWTHFTFKNGIKGSIYTKDLPEWFVPGNTVRFEVRGQKDSCRILIKLLKTMPTYKLTNQNGTVTIETPDGKTLATIPADQAKTFADVEAAIFEQNKGKGNAEECIEATNYFLIHGIKAKQ